MTANKLIDLILEYKLLPEPKKPILGFLEELLLKPDDLPADFEQAINQVSRRLDLMSEEQVEKECIMLHRVYHEIAMEHPLQKAWAACSKLSRVALQEEFLALLATLVLRPEINLLYERLYHAKEHYEKGDFKD